jgi:hypothetical protein
VTTAIKTRRVPFKITPKMMFAIYEMYAKGETEVRIASFVNVSYPKFLRMRKEVAKLRWAEKYGKQQYKASSDTRSEFDNLILGRLPEDLHDIWKRIKREAKKGGVRTTQPLQHMEKRQCQILFVHAWIKCNFSISKACSLTGIPQRTVTLWKTSVEFQKLMEGIQEIKKDLVEDSLLRLIRIGNPLATTFAAKTLLRDRGYGEKTEVVGKVEHSHQHQHAIQFDITTLGLPVDIQMMVLDAMEKKKIADAAGKNAFGASVKVLEHSPA